MFCSLVLLIKTINTYVICIWGYSHLFQEILTKKNKWLRLRWLRQRLAEAETETSHGKRSGLRHFDMRSFIFRGGILQKLW